MSTDDKVEAFLKKVEETEEETNKLFPSLSKMGESLGIVASDVTKLLSLVRVYREANREIAIEFCDAKACKSIEHKVARTAEEKAKDIIDG